MTSEDFKSVGAYYRSLVLLVLPFFKPSILPPSTSRKKNKQGLIWLDLNRAKKDQYETDFTRRDKGDFGSPSYLMESKSGFTPDSLLDIQEA
jgi:hypothetical protein